MAVSTRQGSRDGRGSLARRGWRVWHAWGLIIRLVTHSVRCCAGPLLRRLRRWRPAPQAIRRPAPTLAVRRRPRRPAPRSSSSMPPGGAPPGRRRTGCGAKWRRWSSGRGGCGSCSKACERDGASEQDAATGGGAEKGQSRVLAALGALLAHATTAQARSGNPTLAAKAHSYKSADAGWPTPWPTLVQGVGRPLADCCVGRFLDGGSHDPFAASPSLKWRAAPTCPRRPGAVPETAEHVLLDCPAYAHLRTDPRHACLFQQGQPPPQPAERLRAFTSQQPQTCLASFVCSCFEHHAQPL